jgi:site-specific DNA recombinase
MSKTSLRCAIYTRVSSDQGLEQDFNSLHAQREAAEAYIKSQAHEGWKLHRERYDDGGFSGGSMERPALQKLLIDLAQNRIDVIVVYKVDRLTRSLADFAKLVEVFDANKVSFVSVTQSFNTTSSMGRLTLNVLLSFAQFEREVTGERIRDKIAASKKKGIWMGGVVPLGYRVENRKLLIDEDEVGMVRLIFQRYLELGSLPALQRDLSEKRILTRIRNLSSGRSIGGVALTNGPLSYILKNRLYLGEINHRKVSYQSDHTPIISIELFEAVQTLLAQNLNRKDMRKGKSGALLTGRLFDACGQLMSPSHTTKKGVRYRYYVTAAIAQGRKKEAGMIIRLPAQEIETIVLENLRKLALISMDSDGQSRIEQFGIIGLRVDVCDRTLELSWIERKRNPQQRETSVAITEADNVSASVAADEND